MVRIIPTRFSIRSILLCVALFAGFLAWRLHNPESQIVAAIEKAGGEAIYGYQFDFILAGSKPKFPVVIANQKPELPPTLGELAFGDTALRCVYVVELPLDRITPELITKLESLKHLKHLLVSYPPITSKRIEENNNSRIQIEYPDPKHFETLAELERKFCGRLLY